MKLTWFHEKHYHSCFLGTPDESLFAGVIEKDISENMWYWQIKYRICKDSEIILLKSGGCRKLESCMKNIISWFKENTV